MAGTAQPAATPALSTLAKVANDLTVSRKRMDAAATDMEGLADALCGPSDLKAMNDQDAPPPAGAVNVLDMLSFDLSTRAGRIETALARIRAAIG